LEKQKKGGKEYEREQEKRNLKEKQKKKMSIAASPPLPLLRNLFNAVRKTSKTIKKILPISSIPKAFHYSSAKAISRRSEIGRTSISGSFSLLLSFGEAKERRERKPLPSPCFATKPFQGQKKT
jgi:hypothetical protein